MKSVNLDLISSKSDVGGWWRWLQRLSRGSVMTRVARRQENSHEVNNIYLPNIRATAFNKPIIRATSIVCIVPQGGTPKM